MNISRDLYKREAETILSTFYLFSNSKNDDAYKKYIMAANAYKLDNQYENSSKCYLKASELLNHQFDMHDKIKNMIFAAQCYEKINICLAIEIYSEVLKICLSDNILFNQAYRSQLRITELFEKDNNIPILYTI